MTRRRMLAATSGFEALVAGRAGAETPPLMTSSEGRNGTMDIIRNGSQPWSGFLPASSIGTERRPPPR
jgi:hypothetical protein